MFFSAADMDDGEFRQMVLKDLLINLQQQGFDIDPGIESCQVLFYNIELGWFFKEYIFT